jgi:hypothetical protein
VKWLEPNSLRENLLVVRNSNYPFLQVNFQISYTFSRESTKETNTSWTMGHEDDSHRRKRHPSRIQDCGRHSFVSTLGWFLRYFSYLSPSEERSRWEIKHWRRKEGPSLPPWHRCTPRDQALPKIDRVIDQETPIPATGSRNIAGLQGLTELVIIHLFGLLTVNVVLFTRRRSSASSHPQSPLFKRPLKRISLDYSKTPTLLACTQKE